ncbi:MAG TPA: metallopeptidase family protein [Candidatus Saccharimonadales bacterium]|nr:metallopeptidase family protein [Candidatus Saccharimonadales bacterium]
MFIVSHAAFENMLNAAIKSLPKIYVDHLDNIAFIVEDEPSPRQRQQLELRGDQTLFGLYEGVPLPRRQGTTKLLPDKITLFQKPLEWASHDLVDLRNNIGRTIWHEVAHYYGLGHDRIHELEANEGKRS